MASNRARIGGIVIGINVLLAAIWWLLPLWMYGVFDDGMFYGSISRNLVYDAQATIWDLKVSNTLDPQFNGHPPLGFWLQALFFWWWGDVYWVERVYSLLLALAAMGVLVACWRLFQQQGARLGVFFWLTISIVGWSFGNNLLENLLTVLTGAGIYCLVVAAQATTAKSWGWVLLGGCCIGGAVLTKGPVGLYPLVVPVAYAFFMDKTYWKKAWLATGFLFLLLVVGYFIIIISSPRAALFFEQYWELQLVGSLTGQDSLAPHRLYVLQSLVEELLPPLMLGLLLKGWVHYLQLSPQKIPKKTVFFWLFIALCASLPLLISPKQLRFYIVPSMMWYALAWGLFCWPALAALAAHTQTWKKRKWAMNGLVFLGIVVCVVMSILNRGKNAREVELLADVRQIGAFAGKHTTLHITNSLYNRWNLHAYFYRYYYIDLTTTFLMQPYIISEQGEGYERPGYQEKELGLKELRLHEQE